MSITAGRMGMFGLTTLVDSMTSQNPFKKVAGAVSFFATMPKFAPLDLFNKNKGVFGVNLSHAYVVVIKSGHSRVEVGLKTNKPPSWFRMDGNPHSDRKLQGWFDEIRAGTEGIHHTCL